MVRNCIGFVFLVVFSITTLASPGNRGYSGAPGALGRCASSCHGVNAGTVAITGFPTEYVPDSTYLLSIEAVSGLPIKNFNGSVRVGTGSVTAGVITAGQNTSTYIVAQENNGIHLSVLDRQSGTFNWTAPAFGTGTVRLYVAAHQGARTTGPNTNIVLVADEAVVPQLPDPPTDPAPAASATNVSTETNLSWSLVSDAAFYEVYFGSQNPPELVDGSVLETEYTLSTLSPSSIYFWQIYSVNENGATPGPIWSFTTISLPEPVTSPFPVNGATNVSVTAILSWTSATDAESYEVFHGTTEPLPTFGTTTESHFVFTEPFAVNTTYLWRIDAINVAGTTVGQTWTFTTEAESDANDVPVANEFRLGAAYPNPFNGLVRVNLNLPFEASATVKIFDRTGRWVTTLLDNTTLGRNIELEWNAAGQSAGIYFLRCECAGVSQTQKLVYLP